MANITSLVNTQWYLGLPFNDSSNPRLGIAESGEQILGQSLIGVQVGNEPDLYGSVSRTGLTATPSNVFLSSTVHARLHMHPQITWVSLA
jgi:hypothetical protein